VVKIRVKLGTAEAEVDADPDHLREAIELIPEVIKKLPGGEVSRQDTQTAGRPPQFETSQRAAPATLPTAKIEKSDSLADIIGKFFSDSWGREKRKLSDVREALQSYGLNYPKQSVAVALLRLAKTTKIRRFKAEDGEFVYTTSTAFFAPVAQTAAGETLDELAAPEEGA
jgi:hypothetical protein